MFCTSGCDQSKAPKKSPANGAAEKNPLYLKPWKVLQTVGWSKIHEKDVANFKTLYASVPLWVFHSSPLSAQLAFSESPFPHPASAELSCHQVDILAADAAVPGGREMSGHPDFADSPTGNRAKSWRHRRELWFAANSLRLAKCRAYCILYTLW